MDERCGRFDGVYGGVVRSSICGLEDDTRAGCWKLHTNNHDHGPFFGEIRQMFCFVLYLIIIST